MKRALAGITLALAMLASLLMITSPSSANGGPVYPGTVVTSCKWSSVVSRQLVRGQYVGVRTWARTAGNARPTGWVRVYAIGDNGKRYIRVLPYDGLGMKVLLGRITKGGFYRVGFYFSPTANSVYKPCAFKTTVAVHNR